MNTTAPAFVTVKAAVTSTNVTDEVVIEVGLTAGEAVRLMTDDAVGPIINAVTRAFPSVGMVWVNGWEFSHEDDAKVRREIAARSRMAWEDGQG